MGLVETGTRALIGATLGSAGGDRLGQPLALDPEVLGSFAAQIWCETGTSLVGRVGRATPTRTKSQVDGYVAVIHSLRRPAVT
jgi:hypothetical protein